MWSLCCCVYAPVPAPPSDLEVIGVQSELLQIRWTHAPDVKDSYDVQWKQIDDSQYTSEPVPASVNTKIIDGLTAGATYNVQVLTKSGQERSAPVAISATTGALTMFWYWYPRQI